MISFKETSTLGRGDYIKVMKTIKIGPNHSQYKRLKGKPLTINIGWIQRSHDGMYRYFEPETNEFNPTFIENNLDRLKEIVMVHGTRESY